MNIKKITMLGISTNKLKKKKKRLLTKYLVLRHAVWDYNIVGSPGTSFVLSSPLYYETDSEESNFPKVAQVVSAGIKI